MPKITFITDPSGAEVTFDDRVIGTTPLTHTIDEPVGLAEFRSECLSGGNVTSPWSVLKTRLEDQTVSRIWWNLTRDERYSIAEMAIRNTLFYSIYYYRTGKPNCGGGEGDLKRTSCVNNSVIRCLKFGERPNTVPYWSPNADECYYRRQPADCEHCYVPEVSYGLPCHYVSRISEDLGPHIIRNHALAAIQIVNNHASVNNWIIFQYESFDIKPGHRQVPYGSKITISKPIGFQCGVSYGTTLAEFFV